MADGLQSGSISLADRDGANSGQHRVRIRRIQRKEMGEEGSDASESTGEVKEKPPKMKQKIEASTSEASSGRVESEDGDGDGSDKRKDGEGDGLKKRRREKEDPNPRNKAMSAFIVFSASEREIIERSNPEITFTDISEVVGENWGGYARFSHSIDSDGDGSRKRRRKKKKDSNPRKKAMSGFLFLPASQRESIKTSNPGIAFTEIAEVCGEKWRNMTAEEKAQLEALTRRDEM